MRLKYILSFFLLLAATGSYASADTAYSRRPSTELALKFLAGAHLQMAKDHNDSTYSRKLVEAGVHFTITGDGLRHPKSAFTIGPSVEFSLGESPVYGFKFGGWVNVNLITFGLSTVYYTDFHRGNFKIRPEAGVGFHAAKLTMGLNIPTIANKDFFPLKSSLMQISLGILLKVKTLQTRY